ncbi:hypothetical protein [Luteimonas saliphila]|uniref:hypothetical protein n=1 Tax=Luteimonas saliphila TaxID=2804919 RepID=UPI00192DF8A5|nr:hypothetical protein [Luteimonas saliphila]
MAEVCYLCGRPIDSEPASGDHVIPVSLITRDQPKAKGFDYGGKLPTHADCNNRFGPETYVTKALDLLEFLVGADGHGEFQHRDHPHITIKALDASKLPNFTQRDIEFFKFMDVREEDYDAWSKPEFFNGKQKTNPMRDALHVAFSVLAKSAAALLIKRDLHAVPPAWRIYAAPFSGATDAVDFGGILGDTKSFDPGVHVWRKPLSATDWLVVYRARSVLLFLVFVFSGENAGATLKQHFQGAEVHEFSGTSLNELLTTGWRKL